MSRETVQSLLAELRATASSLVTALDMETLLARLDGLPEVLNELERASTAADFNDSERIRVSRSVRECLLHLQRALIYAESRLRHEHNSTHEQLRELAVQEQWAKASRQIT